MAHLNAIWLTNRKFFHLFKFLIIIPDDLVTLCIIFIRVITKETSEVPLLLGNLEAQKRGTFAICTFSHVSVTPFSNFYKCAHLVVHHKEEAGVSPMISASLIVLK